MRKILLAITAVIAVSLMSCDNTDYKAKGQEYAQKLEQLCEKNDTVAVIAMDDSIRMMDDELMAKGDTTKLNAFREGLRDTRDKVATFVTVSKMQNGKSKDEAVQDVIDDVLNGSGGDVSTVTRSISAAIEHEKNNGIKVEEKKTNPRRQNGTR